MEFWDVLHDTDECCAQWAEEPCPRCLICETLTMGA